MKLTPGLQWSDTIPAAGSLVLVVLFGLGLLLKNNDEQWLYAAPIGTRVAYAALAACRIARVEGGKDLNRKYFLYLLAVGITVSLTSACFLIAHLVGGVAQHLLLQCVTSLMYAAQGLAKVVIEALSAVSGAVSCRPPLLTLYRTTMQRPANWQLPRP